MKRRTFVGALFAGGVIGTRLWDDKNKAALEAQQQANAKTAADAARKEQTEKNQSVLDPIYSVDKLIVKDVKDDATGLTRPEIVKEVAISAGELTVTDKNNENDNKIFVVSNNANQTIKPKGGYNKIMLLPPLDFGKKVIDGSAAGLPAYNELNIDQKILAYYTGTVVMRDQDDLIIKFVKEGQAPNDKTPTITVKNQFAKDGKGVINEFGAIQADGTVKGYKFIKDEMALRTAPWESMIKLAGKDALAAIVGGADVTETPKEDVNVGALEEMLADFTKRAEGLQKEIAAAKEKKVVADDSRLSQAEKNLQTLYGDMRTALTTQVKKDLAHVEDVAGKGFQKMAADVKRVAAEAVMPSVPSH